MLLFLLVVGGGVYLAVKLVPPYWSYLSLMDPVKEAALLAAASQGGEAAARTQLLAAARAQGLELTEDDVEFIREGAGLRVRLSWVTPVEFPRFRYDLHFHLEHTTPIP